MERLTCLMPSLSLDEHKLPPVKDEIMEDLEDVSEKRKRRSRHTGMTQSDKVGSNEEAYLVNEDGEPVVKKRKKSPAKIPYLSKTPLAVLCTPTALCTCITMTTKTTM